MVGTTKKQLYDNTIRLEALGWYDKTEPRYRILKQIAGHNAVAPEQQEVHKEGRRIIWLYLSFAPTKW